MVILLIACLVPLNPLDGFSEPESKQQEQVKSEDKDNVQKLKDQVNQQIDNSVNFFKQKVQPFEDMTNFNEPTQTGDKKNPKPEDVNCKLEVPCHFAKLMYFGQQEAAKQLGSFVENILVLHPKQLTDPTIKKYYNNIKSLSWSFLMLFLTFHSIRILALSMVQENSIELKLIIQKLIAASVLISSQFYIFEKLIEFNRSAIRAISSEGLGDLVNIQKFYVKDHIIDFMKEPFALLFSTTFGVVFIVGVIIMCVQAVIRYAEISFLLIIGPIAISTMMNKEYNFFPIWWKNLLSTIFTQVFQVLLFVMLMTFLTKTLLLENSSHNFIIACGFIFVIIRTPHVLKGWVYSSGATHITIQAGKTAVNTVTTAAKAAL